MSISSPILSSDTLRSLAQQILAMTTAETTVVRIGHIGTGVTRVARGAVRLNNNGDTLYLNLYSRFGQRAGVELSCNQIDTETLRRVVQYLERVASQQLGDPVELEMPISARTYLPNTAWHETTALAFDEARHQAVETLVSPVINAGLTAAAFVGVYLQAQAYADKQGLVAVGRETDSELTVTAWNQDGKGGGWAGQAAREWTGLEPQRVAADAIRLTKLAAHPVALEPGRRVAILDRPAVAQIVRSMGWAFNARTVLSGIGPLYDHRAQRPRLEEQIVDPRIGLSSDPNDPEGGYIPFNTDAYPLIPMTWIDAGILKHLAYDTYFAAERGITPANDPPLSLRMSGGQTSIEEMIANCAEGIYVNRFAQVHGIDSDSGTLTGLTNGSCFLIRNGKIEKAVRHFRFLESPWHFLNRVEAIGPSTRAAFGYSPWHGSWPIAPTIVPPLMIRDFNFNALADAV